MSFEVKYYGHAAFGFKANGKQVLVDPFVANKMNPNKANWQEDVGRVDAICITHGHGDHIGQTLALLAANPECKCYALVETAAAIQKAGAPAKQIVELNKGGWVQLCEGIRGRMCHALHSSSDSTGATTGEAASWMIEGPNGRRVFHTGDTDIFAEMAIYDDMLHPDMILIPVGGHYTLNAEEAAYAVAKLMPRVKYAVPMHYGTFPALPGTPDEFKAAIKALGGKAEVPDLIPGGTFAL